MAERSPSKPQADVVLATLNAKYIHASLGLRYLLANMARHGSADLEARTTLREYTLARPLQEVVHELLALQPRIVGLGVYIWNVRQTTELVRLLKTACPSLHVVLGGPEVSHEWDAQEIVALADHTITGWGDVSFPKLCMALLHGPAPLMKIIHGEQPALAEIELPYAHYSPADLAHRVVYVEASRGCPFKCEFCLSALDKTAWAFDLDRLLQALDELYTRGARTFKFVDRTFNLKAQNSARILQFFLDKLALGPELFVHFELIPDHLPDALKALIAQFPAGALQFEIGIQSLNPQVQQRISRRQDDAKTVENLRWLLTQSQAHLHTDLIFGLPGETLESFAAGFDRLYVLGPHEIQLGILKRLRGAPIKRHTETHELVFDSKPPYALMQSDMIDAPTMTKFSRMASYWERGANAGRFKRTLPMLIATRASAFQAFWDFSDWLWERHGSTHGLSPEQWVDALFDYLLAQSTQPENPGGGDARASLDPDQVRALLLADYVASGARAQPACLRGYLHRPVPSTDHSTAPTPASSDALPASRSWVKRQPRHAGAKALGSASVSAPVAATVPAREPAPVPTPSVNPET